MSDAEKTISFRALSRKIEKLDELAVAKDRTRSYVINEAIDHYLELHAYQELLVRKGLDEMRQGRTVGHDEVVKQLRKRTRRAS